jgi:hypothetical protein
MANLRVSDAFIWMDSTFATSMNIPNTRCSAIPLRRPMTSAELRRKFEDAG